MSQHLAISLWQPWASAVALGLKTFETRSWAAECPVGTRLAIHAARRDVGEKGAAGQQTRGWWLEHVKRAQNERAQTARAVFEAAGIFDWCDLPLGAVVCTAELVAVHRTEDLVEKIGVSALECVWGNYAPGRYAWQLAKRERLARPVPAKGWQNFFTVDLATGETKGLPPAGRGRVAA